MDDRSWAEEDLRVIRSLMERATVYRAISSPTALVGGVLAIVTTALIYWNNEVSQIFGHVIRGRQFVKMWVVTLAVVLMANAYFIWREARRTGRPFISSGMRLALLAIAPCLLVPATFTAWFYSTGYLGGAELDLVVVWIVSYGLALLSTALFAPRSLALLGWAVLITGLGVPSLTHLVEYFSVDVPLVSMGLTFGVYHLIYSLCTWPRKGEVKIEQLASE
jgi:hypothetical protein